VTEESASERRGGRVEGIQVLQLQDVRFSDPRADIHVAHLPIAGCAWVDTDDGVVLIDTLISAVVAVGFGAVTLLERSAWVGFVPYADPALVIFLVFGMLPLPLRIIRHAYRQVIGAVPVDAESQVILEEVEAELSSLPGHEHWLRLMRVGRQIYVHLYVLPPESRRDSALLQQDALRAGLYERLHPRFPNLALDVVFTADPVWSDRSVGLESA